MSKKKDTPAAVLPIIQEKHVPIMKYRPEDEQRLKKTVSDFNKKVRKLEKSGQVAPERISLTETRKLAQESRQDFNRINKSLERFQRETAAKPHTFKEYGITVTHWEALEVSRMIATNNRKRAKLKAEYDQLTITNKGKVIPGSDGQPLKRAQMQGPQSNALKPKEVDLNKTYTVKSFRMLQQAVKKEAQKMSFEKQNKQWKKNYLDAINKVFPGKDSAKIRAAVKKLSPEEFTKIMRSEQNADIAFHYGKKFDMEDKKDILQTLKNIFLPPETVTIPVKST